MPLSLLEAMSYGRCCVTSDIPECASVLAGSGKTFKHGDVDDLLRVLTGLINAPEFTGDLGEAAKSHVLSTYDWDSVVERTLEIYRGDAR